ncbi:MAG: Cof-type HAD-IIB family hydrolase [Lachnospiraceae bacterium]|nr:Cof-type HAD-IIB family hydrolase [Lachnospiraceae bacterium]MEE1015039.1 Cof-type HAD-IIB family hydrolase [Lachnospiraceae bacterium]
MIKAAFFDVDGTVYSHESKCVPESTIEALKALRKKGIKTFLATGRHFSEIDEFPVGKIPFDGYVMLTGQLCTDGKRNVIFGNAIDGADAEYLLNEFKKKEMPVMLVEKDKLYINLVNEIVINGQAEISSPIPEVMEYKGDPVYQIICYGGKELEMELIPKLPNCKITRWCPFGIDVISKTGGKVTGIKKMLEVHGIGQEEVIAFGDGENDIEMLQFAGIGVAMGNAEPEVKAVADYVTTDIDDDGILNALKHFEIL